jgi:hypothetical protein
MQPSKPISQEVIDENDRPPLAPSSNLMGDDPDAEDTELANQVDENAMRRKQEERRQLEEAMRASMDKYNEALNATLDEIRLGKPAHRRTDDR